MKLSRRALAGAVTLVIGAAYLSTANPASAATAPPWQPEASTFATGTLSFFDSSGAQITGGSTTASPFAAYVQGSQTARAGDTVANLYFYTPNSTLAPGAWTGALIGSTSYPNSTAPSALASSSLPLESGQAGDESLATYIAATPNNDTTAGYANAYEIRVKTTKPGTAGASLWEVADIAVSGSTWTQVYPSVTSTATTTTLTAAPTSGTAGAAVTLTATISPAAPGTVQFTDGGATLGAPVTVSGGTASTTVSFSTTGTHNLTAAFTSSSASFANSQGTLAYSVGAAPATPTTTALGVNPTSGPAYSPVTLTATTTPTAASGTVQFFDGTTSLGSASVSGGTASITYSLFAQGAHSLTATFTPSDLTAYTASSSPAVSFSASAPTGPTPSNANLQAEADAGQLTITTPYTTGAPLDLGHLQRNANSTSLSTSAVFGSSATPIQVTDTRAGNLPWTAYAQTTDFTSGSNTINGENLGFTNIQYVETAGNALSHTNVSIFDIPAALAVSTTDPGSSGLKGSPHKFAATVAGDGTIGFFGTLTLTAPTSTLAGTYVAVITFTVG